jgi:hypothetical protein
MNLNEGDKVASLTKIASEEEADASPPAPAGGS